MEKRLEHVLREKWTLDLFWYTRTRILSIIQARREAVQRVAVNCLFIHTQQVFKKLVISLTAQPAEIVWLDDSNYSFRMKNPAWISVTHLCCHPGYV